MARCQVKSRHVRWRGAEVRWSMGGSKSSHVKFDRAVPRCDGVGAVPSQVSQVRSRGAEVRWSGVVNVAELHRVDPARAAFRVEPCVLERRQAFCSAARATSACRRRVPPDL